MVTFMPFRLVPGTTLVSLQTPSLLEPTTSLLGNARRGFQRLAVHRHRFRILQRQEPSAVQRTCLLTDSNVMYDSTSGELTQIYRFLSFACNKADPGADWGPVAQCTTTTREFRLESGFSVYFSRMSTVSTDYDGNFTVTTPIVNALGIQVRWQSSDSSLLWTTPSQTQTTSIPPPSQTHTISIPPPSQTSSIPSKAGSLEPSQEPSQPPTPTRMPKGTIIGISVALPLVFIILVAIIIRLMVLRKRQRRAEGHVSTGPSRISGTEGWSYDTSNAVVKPELPVPEAEVVHTRNPEVEVESSRGGLETTAVPHSFRIDTIDGMDTIRRRAELG